MRRRRPLVVVEHRPGVHRLGDDDVYVSFLRCAVRARARFILLTDVVVVLL
jgi:hypothetical protein